MTAPEQWAWLARIRRTQGRKGEVFAEILTDFPDKFSERKRLWLMQSAPPANVSSAFVPAQETPREVELVHHWLHKGGVVLHLAGVDSISAAEELAGMIVAIPRAARAVLEEGDFYIGDLIGCVLVDVAGAEPVVVGEIEDVDRSLGPVAMFVVKSTVQPDRTSAGSRDVDDEVLIPFAKEYLRNIDLEAKRVYMELPEGLVELNRPEQS
jgi:16S rRNA processing protein RimM